ncbi:peptidase [Microbispora rosea subsp. aerata]|nr:peptidase [Microbispora rosea subsp. aerata]GIH54110.1 peptidase [Microbispora rosea subsp. aerata]GLJ85083.1 peptidase [Microbispora rosea subsp. aerata]
MIALGIGLGVFASAVVCQPAQAADAATVPLARTTAAAQEVARFWLADDGANLKRATPYAVLTSVGGERLGTGIVPDGKPVLIAPRPGSAAPQGGMPTTSGKVFFIGDDLQPHWCSGTAVQSRYRNVVATAGHCLLDVQAPMGPLAKWVFVPGYSDGAAPFGLYVGKQGIAPYAFDDIRDFDGDYAFVNVYEGVALSAPDVLTDVGKLADNVGGQGLAFNEPLASTVDVFGYPAGPNPDGSSPYTGETLERSTGPAYAVNLTGRRMDRPVGVDSPFTGEGSLGSPWLIRYADDSGAGYVNGVTIGVADTDGDGRYDTGVSPYFDSEAYGIYRYAEATWTGRVV